MKSSRFITLLITFAVLSSQAAAIDKPQPQDTQSGANMYSLNKTVPAPGTLSDAQLNLNLQQTDQAESVRKSEEDYQKVLTAVASAIRSLEDRTAQMRSKADQPATTDVGRLEQDIRLISQELDKVSVTNPSPLIQIQRADLQDRIFEMQLTLELLKRRWGGSWKIFGMDFFNSAPAVDSTDYSSVPLNYKVRVGDKLRVTVSSSLGSENEYSPVVDSTGKIFISGIGNITASGKTASELQAALTNLVRSKFKQLSVAVSVDKLRAIRVQVTGEVARPGTYSLTGLSTVFNALYQAGGPSKSGSFRLITLERDGEGRRVIDLYDLLLNGSKKGDIPLEDGDLIFVPSVGGTVVVEGEVNRPARYEPSFPLTLSQALKMAGGPKPGAYLQAVQVERVENGEYRTLLSETLQDVAEKPDMALKPGDQVTVTSIRPDRTGQVIVSGPVGSPGTYGFKEGMLVSELIKISQGLAPDKEVYGARADILRTDPLKGTEIITFNLNKALENDPENNLVLQKLDRVFVYEPEQVTYRPRLVTISGAVAKPGTYKRTDGMSVRDAIAAAGGTLPEAFLTRADVIRTKDDGATELIRVNLASALTGDANANVKLSDRDTITIYTQQEARWSDRTVRIEGAVQRPGVYTRSDNMRLGDLIFASGGLVPEAAGKVEVAHFVDGVVNDLMSIDVDELAKNEKLDILLNDGDVVTIPSVNPWLRSPEVVYITGEVANPGPYTLSSPDEKLTDLIKRAGGLTDYADKAGMLFLRQTGSFANSQQSTDADLVLQKSRLFADKQFVMSLANMGVPLPATLVQAIQDGSDKLAKPSEVVKEERLEEHVNSTEQAQQLIDNAQTRDMSQSQTESRNPAQIKNPGSIDQAQINKLSDKAAQTGNQKQQLPPFNNTSSAAAQSVRPVDINVQNLELLEDKVSAMGSRVEEYNSLELPGYQGRQEMAELTESTRISVNLNQAFADYKSPDNIPLMQGDRIFIPKVTNVVTVIGAVLHPHSFAAGPGKNVDYYIERSGGYSQEAAKNNVIVIRSNGDAMPKNRVASVQPGDMIVVPTTGLIDITKKWNRITPVAKVISDVLSSIYVLTKL